MARARLELADVVRTHRDAFLASRGGRLSRAERRVLDDIAGCRTAACGAHVERCNDCGHQRIAYNSCRNRHCPKCQESTRAEWLVKHERDVLPIQYFHVVFTIPHELADLALQNKREVYGLLFRASAETLCQIAADPKHLGAQIGFLSVLHTWGQNLQHHPHVHCLVSGGGIALDRSRWLSCRPGFFLPVRVLSRLFRGKFLGQLRRAFDQGRLDFHGGLAHLRSPSSFYEYLAPLYHKEWAIYSKPPFAGPDVVLRYLARYTNRVAISNSRLLAVGQHVTFLWKDYRHRGKQRRMTLSAVQFLRRFLLHILPQGFMRIRHYGFLANRSRRVKLDLCRQLLAAVESHARAVMPANDAAGAQHASRCPRCEHGRMVCVLVIGRTLALACVALRAPPDSL